MAPAERLFGLVPCPGALPLLRRRVVKSRKLNYLPPSPSPLLECLYSSFFMFSSHLELIYVITFTSVLNSDILSRRRTFAQLREHCGVQGGGDIARLED